MAIAGVPSLASAQQFGMVGLGLGQTLRLNVVALPQYALGPGRCARRQTDATAALDAMLAQAEAAAK